MQKLNPFGLNGFGGDAGGGGTALGETGYEGNLFQPPNLAWTPSAAAWEGVADKNPYTRENPGDPYLGQLEGKTSRLMVAFAFDPKAANPDLPTVDTSSQGWIAQGIVLKGGIPYYRFVSPDGDTTADIKVSDMTPQAPEQPGPAEPPVAAPPPAPPSSSTPTTSLLTSPPSIPDPAPTPAGLSRNGAPGPSAPDWTTQTGWRFTKSNRKGLPQFDPVTSYDSGNRLQNVIFNYGVLLLRNLVADIENVALDVATTTPWPYIDDVFERSPLKNEYQAAAVMLPMAPAMGIAVETGLALEYSALRLSSAWSRFSTNPRVLTTLLAPIFTPGLAAEGVGTTTPPAVEFEHVGRSLATGDGNWFDYQLHATGTPYEEFFRVQRNGVKQPDVLPDALTNGYIVEAKEGTMGQLFNQERLDHTTAQVANYLEIADAFGLRGVRYAVSTLGGVEVLERLFAELHPEALASGFLSVWWVPW